MKSHAEQEKKAAALRLKEAEERAAAKAAAEAAALLAARQQNGTRQMGGDSTNDDSSDGEDDDDEDWQWEEGGAHWLAPRGVARSLGSEEESWLNLKKNETKRGIPPVNFMYILWNKKTSVARHIQGQIYSRVCVCECVDWVCVCACV